MSIDSVLYLLGDALDAAAGVFASLVSNIGGTVELIVAGFSILIVVQLLILPLRGAGSPGRSDRIKKEKATKKHKVSYYDSNTGKSGSFKE